MRTPVFTRFSTVAGGAGSVDTPRDVRGFAVKFYTQEGNFDLVGNNIPVFFIQDAMKFPDLVHAVKMEPDRGFPQAGSAHDTFWDFISLTPEAMHMIMWAMSDRTIPRSLRMIEGFGVHSFRLLDAKGRSTFCKFHWRPKLGLQSTCWDEAVKLQGADNDFHRRDLFEAIQAGNFPEWELGVQLFTEEQADAFPFDHLDADQADPRGAGAADDDRPHGARPLARQLLRRDRAGRLLPGQHRARHRLQQRSAAAGPAVLLPRHAAVAPGRAELPPAADQRAEVPVRQPPARRPHADAGAAGPRRTTSRARSTRRSARATPAGFRSFAERGATTAAKGRIRSEAFADHYSQARLFYRSQSEIEQAHMAFGAGVRAVEGGDAARARGHGRPPAQHRRRPRPARRRRPRHGRAAAGADGRGRR